MPFQNMQPFTFNHSDQQDAIYTEYTAQQIKALFDSRGDELRTALNLLVTALNSVEGASNIGTQSIQDVDGETIQSMLKSIRDKLKSKIDGSSGADYVNATAIEGLTGETVQSLLEALKVSLDGAKTTLDTKIDTTKTALENSISTSLGNIKASTISADPIAVGSGTTVQAQLAWLLSQIAIAATGSIPDGSISEVKLTQAVVDKINKALSNVGVLTTLLTNDKSSLVNALNEHLADYMYQIPTIVGTQIRLNRLSGTNRLFFKLENNLIGDVTISTDGGETEKPLLDIDNNPITQLDKGFVEVVADANFFILRNRGLGGADKQALINIVNEAERNESDLKTQFVDAVNAVDIDGGINLPVGATWADILTQVPNIKTGKKWASGTVLSASNSKNHVTYTGGNGGSSYIPFDMTILEFEPSVVVFYETVTVSGGLPATTWFNFNYYYVSESNFGNVYSGALYRVPYATGIVDIPVRINSKEYTWIAFE